MERKNTVLLTVIAVATLLVAVVGATFAYFTATNKNNDISGANAGEITTTKLGNTTFSFEGKSLEESYLEYPGGLAVFGSKAQFTKNDGEADDNTYNLNFDLEIDYKNQTGTDLYWALYMVEGDALASNLDPQCKLFTKAGQDGTHFWYGDEGQNDDDTKSCTLTSEQKNVLLGTTMIAYGKMSSGESSGTIGPNDAVAEAGGQTSDYSEVSPTTCSGKLCDPNGGTTNNLKNRTLDSNKTTTKHYYLVVQYPNQNSNQALTDQEKGISITLKVADGTPKVTVADNEKAQITES